MYARINTVTGVVESQVGVYAAAGVGPYLPPPEAEPGIEYAPIDAPIDWSGRPSATAVMRWNAGACAWSETASAIAILPGVIAAIDATADAARLMAIGDPARALEYQQADAQAREYRDRQYQGTVPPDVLSWAEPQGWTGQQAADDIIATADRWRAALSAIRKLRLAAKGAARDIAGDPEGEASAIYAVKTTFLSTLHTLMMGIA